MWVYDIHAPYHPTLLGIYPSKARKVQIADGVAYISADGDGLQVVRLWQTSIFLPQIPMGEPSNTVRKTLPSGMGVVLQDAWVFGN